MKKFLILCALIFALCISNSLQARIIHVPADSSTIQAGINGAVNGDTVLVAPGSYPENISFNGKGILVASNYIFNPDSSIIENTIISGTGPKVTFSGEDSTSAIKGFSIVGFPFPYPGNRGIVCRNSSPVITNNIIRQNAVYVFYYEVGAGIYCNNSHPLIWGNVIKDNVACWGAGMYLTDSSSPIIEENVIENNNTVSSLFTGSGAGIWSSANSNPIIRNNIIKSNSVDVGDGGGISCYSAIICNNILFANGADYGGGISCGSAIITNNTIYRNGGGGGGIICGSSVITNNIVASNNGNGIRCSMGSTPVISYNNVWNNTGGNFSNCDPDLGLLDTVNVNGDSCDRFINISYDPLFADTMYHLSSGSPCMEAGSYVAQGLLKFDFDGEPRIMDGDSNGVAIVDIGADEFPGEPLLFGDVNSDGAINLGDVVYLIGYLWRGGPSPDPYVSGDTNCDGRVTLSDVVYLINYLYYSGLPPGCNWK